MRCTAPPPAQDCELRGRSDPRQVRVSQQRVPPRRAPRLRGTDGPSPARPPAAPGVQEREFLANRRRAAPFALPGKVRGWEAGCWPVVPAALVGSGLQTTREPDRTAAPSWLAGLKLRPLAIICGWRRDFTLCGCYLMGFSRGAALQKPKTLSGPINANCCCFRKCFSQRT